MSFAATVRRRVTPGNASAVAAERDLPCHRSRVPLPDRQVGLAKIEFAFDPAPRLVLELAGAKELVDVLAFRRDQQQFDLVVERAVFSVDLVAAARPADTPEPF